MLSTIEHDRVAVKPDFPVYTRSDIRSGKELEDKLLGTTIPEVQMNNRMYAEYLADEIQVIDNADASNEKPDFKEILAYFNRGKIANVLGEKAISESSDRIAEIGNWIHTALSRIRKKMTVDIDGEINKIKESQSENEVSAFAYNFSERFELLQDINSNKSKRVVRLFGRLVNMRQNEYFKSKISSVISQDELRKIFTNSFGLKWMPSSLEGFVTRSDIDRDTFEHGIVDLNSEIDIIDGLRPAVDQICENEMWDDNGGLHAKVYSATDTLLDLAGGVDGFIEVSDENGNVISRNMIDVTTNQSKMNQKQAKINSHESFATDLFLFNGDDILPIDNSGEKTKVLNNKNFLKLFKSVNNTCSRNVKGILH